MNDYAGYLISGILLLLTSLIYIYDVVAIGADRGNIISASLFFLAAVAFFISYKHEKKKRK